MPRRDLPRAGRAREVVLSLLAVSVLVSAWLVGAVIAGNGSQILAAAPLPPRAALLPVGVWTSVSPVGNPGISVYDAMAYSPDADRVVLVTEEPSGVLTWLYDVGANNWTQVPKAPSSPGAAGFASLVYDPAVRKFVLFGGFGFHVPNGFLGTNETWLFDPSSQAWTNVTPRVSPPTRYGQGMVYLPDTDRILMFGGEHEECPDPCSMVFVYARNDTWLYDVGSNTWTNVTAADSPAGEAAPKMAYDPGLRRVFMASGYRGTTWLYDPVQNAWQQIGDWTERPEFYEAGVAYDSAVRSVVLFEASSGLHLVNNTWYFNATARTWTNVTTLAAPEPRYGAALAYDSNAGVLVMYGGRNYTSTFNGTWLYRATTPPALFASIRGQPVAGSAPLVVAFEAIPRGGLGPYTCAWEFGDGSEAQVAAPAHVFMAPGSYTVQLTVTDSLENATMVTVVITVGPAVHGIFSVPLVSGGLWSVGLVTAAGLVAAVATYWILRLRPPRPR